MEIERDGTILVVDDEVEIRELICEILRDAGFVVADASSAARALELLEERPYAVILTDHNMPGITGIEMIRQIRARGDRTPIILHTGQATMKEIVQGAMVAGADMILPKPSSIEMIVAAVQRFMPVPPTPLKT